MLLFRIGDVIISLDQFEHLNLDDNFDTTFPKSVTLDQTIAVWKHTVLYQEKLNKPAS